MLISPGLPRQSSNGGRTCPADDHHSPGVGSLFVSLDIACLQLIDGLLHKLIEDLQKAGTIGRPAHNLNLM